MSIDSIRTRLLLAIESPSPAVKQAATALSLAAAAAIALGVPGVGFASPPFAIAGLVIVALATVISIIFTASESLAKWALIIPIIDLLGLGAFRMGTGGTASMFSALMILPVVWIAVSNGRKYIAYSGLGVLLSLLMPAFIAGAVPSNPIDWVRALFAAIVFTIAAGIINEVAHQSRQALSKMHKLADDKELMLQRTVEYAAQLQESESKYRAADRMFRGVWAAVTEQAVIGTDVTGLIDAWNPGATKILGPSAFEAEDKMYIFDFHLPEELEDRARELNYPPGETVLNPGFSALVETARLGRADVREWTWLRSDGTPVPVELSVTKRVDEGGRTRGYLFVASDVTKQREVARLKDEFVGLISHELRTPLSSILGYLELMRDDEVHPLSDEQLQYLSVAERNANRLLRLVGDLLFTAQVESGRFPLDNRDMALGPIVTASVETGRPMADAAGVELLQLVPDAALTVHGDPVRLGQAVDNLISNAIKFTPRGGTVTVELAQHGDDALITVRDTGLGIAASEMDKLFSRFFRATTATRNAVPGVGLGLTITKAIVTAHHGEMSVQSEEGVGTAFGMSIPLVRTPALAAPPLGAARH
jgi:signal transduction histidine kinase